MASHRLAFSFQKSIPTAFWVSLTAVQLLTGNALAADQQPVRIGGSSTVYPILKEAIRSFQAVERNSMISIKLSESGTSAGLREFCKGKLSIANASRPINSKELKACADAGITFIELPIAFDALTVVVNPKNTWAQQISTTELAKLWEKKAQGRIVRWKQVNNSWPDRAISLCGPGKDSGTYDYFNKAINGDEDNSRSDYMASEDDQLIVQCVAKNPNALGYFGYSYFKENAAQLRALSINSGKGAIAPSLATVQKSTYFPLSRPLFIYVNDRDSIERSEVRAFLTHTVSNGLDIVERAGSIPLSESTYRLVESKLYKHVLGTSFGGDLPVGLSIGEALRRSFDALKRPAYR
jgi:phosphate transport system substrate-binding protein